jgi:hypothetical protein
MSTIFAQDHQQTKLRASNDFRPPLRPQPIGATHALNLSAGVEE